MDIVLKITPSRHSLWVKQAYFMRSLGGMLWQRLLWVIPSLIEPSSKIIFSEVGKLLTVHLCASVTKQYNLVPAKGSDLFGYRKVTVGLVEFGK